MVYLCMLGVRFCVLPLCAISLLANRTIGKVEDRSQWSSFRPLTESDVITATSATTVYLNNGGKLWLAAGSRGTFYNDHLTLEKGRARLDLHPGYEVQARGVSLHPTAGLSTVTIGFLETGNIALAVWKGSVRVASGAKVIENLMAGAMLEFMPPQLPGSSGSPGGGPMPGPGGGGGAGGNCPAQICLNGPISYEGQGKDMKAFITDEATGIKVELVGAAPGLQANGVKAGTRFAVAGNVDTKADPADNTGLKIKVTGSRPLVGPAPDIFTLCGVISEENGKYYLTWPETGLRYEINADKDLAKSLDKFIAAETKREEKWDEWDKRNKSKVRGFKPKIRCIKGTAAPPAKGETHPTLSKPTLVAALDLESDNRFRDALVLATISATAISVTTATIIDSGGNESISPTRP